MAVWKNLSNSLSTGWLSLSKHPFLSLYTILSIAYVYLVLETSSIISSFSNIDTSTFDVLLFLFTGLFLLLGATGNHKLNLKINLATNFIGIFFAILLAFQLKGAIALFSYSFFGGLSAGFSLPKIISAFLDFTNFENRGSICGILTFLGYVIILSLTFSTLVLDSILYLAVVFLIIKIVSMMSSILSLRKVPELEKATYTHLTTRIKFSFWTTFVIFVVVNSLVSALLSQTPKVDTQSLGLESAGFSLVAFVVGGAFMDNWGRRNIMVFAFTYLGLDYGLVSLANQYPYYYLTVLDGIAWGILLVLFLLVLWGDLCPAKSRPFWIAISLIVAASTTVLRDILPNIIGSLKIDQLFPLTSLFLFAAVGIILYLPETLPERIIKKKELNDYIQQVKKVREKYKKEK